MMNREDLQRRFEHFLVLADNHPDWTKKEIAEHLVNLLDMYQPKTQPINENQQTFEFYEIKC